MSVSPRITLVAWADRKPGFIFVAVPNERGRYVRTDSSVALVTCPQCLAIPGEPCRSGTGEFTRYGGTTHYHRRAAAGRQRGQAGDVLAAEPLETTPEEDMGDNA